MDIARLDQILGNKSSLSAASKGETVTFQQTEAMEQCVGAIKRFDAASSRPGRPLELSSSQLPPIF